MHIIYKVKKVGDLVEKNKEKGVVLRDYIREGCAKTTCEENCIKKSEFSLFRQLG